MKYRKSPHFWKSAVLRNRESPDFLEMYFLPKTQKSSFFGFLFLSKPVYIKIWSNKDLHIGYLPMWRHIFFKNSRFIHLECQCDDKFKWCFQSDDKFLSSSHWLKFVVTLANPTVCQCDDKFFTNVTRNWKSSHWKCRKTHFFFNFEQELLAGEGTKMTFAKTIRTVF